MLTACVTADDDLDTAKGKGGTVLTQFNVSIFNQPSTTRMSDDVVQQGQNLTSFRGIQDIVLKPFAVDNITITSTPLGDNVTLAKMVKPQEYSSMPNYIPAGPSYLLSGSQSALYQDVDIPVGTKGFLFYGKAIDNVTASSSNADKHAYGMLTPSGLDGNNLNAVQFKLSSIDPNAALDANGIAQHLVDYLNKIAQATNSSDQPWSATTGELRQLYEAFIGKTDNGVKALGGSSRNVQASIQELYTSARNNSALEAYVMDDILESTPTGSSEKYATDSNNDGILEFNTTLLGNVDTNEYFPANIGLPDGAAIVAWKTDQFEMVQTYAEAQTFTPNLTTSDMAYYVYPPALYYYANTPVKTSTAWQKDNYTSDKTWGQILDLYTENEVTGQTHSLVLSEPVQYGVGCMEVRVKCSSTTVTDQQGFGVSYGGSGFPITAVIVGNQKNAAFDFTPIGENPYYVYDNVMPDNFVASYTTSDFSTMTPSRTLVMETGANDPVNIAVEFVNNSGHDFYGNNGDLIAKGCKFYLIAQLTPEEAIEGYNADTNNKVFQQDHVTKVNLTIESLANAYNVVPDLRLPKLDLGLLVNLEWQTGIQLGDAVIN